MTSARFDKRDGTQWGMPVPGASAARTPATDEVAIVNPDTPLPDCLADMASCRQGVAVVVDKEDGRPVGLLDARALLSRVLQGRAVCQRAEQAMRSCDELIAQPRNALEAEELLEQKHSPYLIVVNENGSYKETLTLCRVLSQRRQRYREYVQRLEETMDEMRADIHQMQEEHTEILGVLAHDLRGPLGGILGLGRMVSTDGKLPEEKTIREYFRLICREGEQCLRLTGEILEFSRHRSRNVPLEIASCSSLGLLDEVCRLYEELAKHKGIAFEVKRPSAAPPDILADRQRLYTVLANLIDNAVKYCNPGEKISVSLDVQPRRISYIVADNGQGLPKEEQEKLFVRFYRGSSKPTAGEASTGLGLAIAREIIEAHGGHISVSGDRGQGLSFRVDLPVHCSPVLATAET